MKKILIIWSIGALLNIFMISVEVFLVDYFSQKRWIPVLWVGINFVPLSVAVAYYTFNDIAIKSKKITYWLISFLVLCLLSLFSRTLIPDYQTFENFILWIPFVLLPLQLFILFQLLRAGRMQYQFDVSFQSQNRDQAIEYIQKGNTLKALDLLLEESKHNGKVYEYLSLQKSTLSAVKQQHLSNTIENEKYQRTVNQVTQSLLDLLIT